MHILSFFFTLIDSFIIFNILRCKAELIDLDKSLTKDEKPKAGFFGFSFPKLPFNLFGEVPCVSSSLQKGTCVEASQCQLKGGFEDGKDLCLGKNVCCVLGKKCGEVGLLNNTIFSSPDYPETTQKTGQCVYKVKLLPFVQSLRISFIKMSLNQPDYYTGECNVDAFWVEGADKNFQLGKLCGVLSGTHIYVPVKKSLFLKEVTLHVALSDATSHRRWLLKVDQLHDKNSEIPPDYCLQYYTGENGTISSFNANLQSKIGLGNIKGLKYVTCIRQEEGYCKIQFEPFFFEMGYNDNQINKSYSLTTLTKNKRSAQNHNLVKYYQPVYSAFKPLVKPVAPPLPDEPRPSSAQSASSQSSSSGIKSSSGFSSNPLTPYYSANSASTTQPTTYSFSYSIKKLPTTPVSTYSETLPSSKAQLNTLADLKNKIKLMLENYDKMTNVKATTSYPNFINFDSEYSDENSFPYEHKEPQCKNQDIVSLPFSDDGGPTILCGNSFYQQSPYESSSAPYLVRVNNKGHYNGKGFVLKYKQFLC